MIDDFILRHNLKKVYAYLNDLTVTGSTLEEHDQNLQKLLAAAEQDGLTFDKKNQKYDTRKYSNLGMKFLKLVLSLT